MDTLLLTLGHNSSAIHIRDEVIVAGYEEERLSRHKSDSAFPLLAIRRLGLEYYDEIMVSHWDPFCNLSNMPHRHWRPDLLPHHGKLITLSKDFTHHDAHMMSAKCFEDKSMPSSWTIVADGFGNYGETMSIYDPNDVLVHRARGYMSSLGLMYQYAVDYLGMKMNQDEYKLLGYESLLSIDKRHSLDVQVLEIYKHMLTEISNVSVCNHDDPLFNLTALIDVNIYWHRVFAPLNKSRADVAYVVQSVVENVISTMVDKYKMEDVTLVGGLFQNVKLNNTVLEKIDGKLNVMPLSGDQGAALGLYRRANPFWKAPNHLYWGRRKFTSINRPRTYSHVHIGPVIEDVRQLIYSGHIVNLIYGSMEFGARALGHTSTLAKPTKENVEYINNANGRDTIMPMGPIVTDKQASVLFPNYEHMCSGVDYMTVAMQLDDHELNIMGVSHIVTSPRGMDYYTCRAQVIHRDHVLYHLVEYFGPLINTSFNIHGVPIAFDKGSINKCISYQQARDPDERIYNVILLGENHDIR